MKISAKFLSAMLYLSCVLVASNAQTPALLAQVDTPGALAPAQSPTQQPISLPPGTAGPQRVSGQGPIYPQAAKVQHLAGVVKLHAIIDTEGNITELTLISSTDPIFVDAAMVAVKKWKYRPYLLNGVPTAVRTNIAVNFSFGQ